MERGVFALTKLTLRYCKDAGNSRGVREFIKSDLGRWASENKQVTVSLQQVQNKAPIVIGHYPKEVEKVINLDNKNSKTVEKQFEYLLGSTGRRATRVTANQMRSIETIQGAWSPTCTEGVQFKVQHSS
eukprot:g1509.t1